MDADFLARAAAIRRAEAKAKQAAALEKGRLLKNAAVAAQLEDDRLRAVEAARIQAELDDKAAAAARQAEAEQAQRDQQAAQQRAVAQADEQRRAQQAQDDARERQRREEARMRGHAEAERRAEELAAQLSEMKLIRDELDRARGMGLITQQKQQIMEHRLPTLSAQQRKNMLAEVHEVFDEHLRESQRQKQAESRRQSEYAEAVARRRASTPLKADFVAGDSIPTEQELLRISRESSKAQGRPCRDATVVAACSPRIVCCIAKSSAHAHSPLHSCTLALFASPQLTWRPPSLRATCPLWIFLKRSSGLLPATLPC